MCPTGHGSTGKSRPTDDSRRRREVATSGLYTTLLAHPHPRLTAGAGLLGAALFWDCLGVEAAWAAPLVRSHGVRQAVSMFLMLLRLSVVGALMLAPLSMNEAAATCSESCNMRLITEGCGSSTLPLTTSQFARVSAGCCEHCGYSEESSWEMCYPLDDEFRDHAWISSLRMSDSDDNLQGGTFSFTGDLCGGTDSRNGGSPGSVWQYDRLLAPGFYKVVLTIGNTTGAGVGFEVVCAESLALCDGAYPYCSDERPWFGDGVPDEGLSCDGGGGCSSGGGEPAESLPWFISMIALALVLYRRRSPCL